MQSNELFCGRAERAVLSLRALYRAHGYSQYKMSKFEEYDLYVRNKSFLISDHVITFTDTTGRLLALKPDVTLSIVKNSRDTAGVKKVYYNENVYRTAAASHDFREITQVGLECMGEIDAYCTAEVLSLAARSLDALSPEFVLEVSHLDVVSHLLDSVGAEGAMRAELLRFLAEKNTHDIRALCASCGWDNESVELLCALVAVSGTPSSVRAQLDALSVACPNVKGAMDELYDAIGQLETEGFGAQLRLEFSLINDMNYYNGIVFRGYIKGVPTRILSGGRYDGLMHKMGKRQSAIGFAVYLDLLDGLNEPPAEYDVDTVVLYDATTPTARVSAAVAACVSAGERALALRELTDGLRYRELVDLRGDKCCE